MARTGELYLHEAMEYVLMRAGEPLDSNRIAEEINAQALFTRRMLDEKPLQWWQVELDARKFPMKFRLDGRVVWLRPPDGPGRAILPRTGAGMSCVPVPAASEPGRSSRL
ncbi:hypothetical protein [Mangrovicoccus ximenensis]|uniref:hypothetical protein n=1 Tax=Mangrovicoccus ximenensis TaxID=1911570 RepID=UPI000D3446A2|nr:hypothetical protein [Mangrovicoccus ximenensis]